MYRSLLALTQSFRRDFISGLERAVDEAGDVEFTPFYPFSLGPNVMHLLAFSSEVSDCPFPSCLHIFPLRPFSLLLSECKPSLVLSLTLYRLVTVIPLRYNTPTGLDPTGSDPTEALGDKDDASVRKHAIYHRLNSALR